MKPYTVHPPQSVYGWHVRGPNGVIDTFGPGEASEARATTLADHLNVAYVVGYSAGELNAIKTFAVRA